APLHDRDARVGGAEVDADDFGHFVNPLLCGRPFEPNAWRPAAGGPQTTRRQRSPRAALGMAGILGGGEMSSPGRPPAGRRRAPQHPLLDVGKPPGDRAPPRAFRLLPAAPRSVPPPT